MVDVGCGCGRSTTVVMAQRFPKSQFYAYEDLSPESLPVIQERARDLDNLTMRNVAEQSLGKATERFSFVDYSHDLLHDMHDRSSIFDQSTGRLPVLVSYKVQVSSLLALASFEFWVLGFGDLVLTDSHSWAVFIIQTVTGKSSLET